MTKAQLTHIRGLHEDKDIKIIKLDGTIVHPSKYSVLEFDETNELLKLVGTGVAKETFTEYHDFVTIFGIVYNEPEA